MWLQDLQSVVLLRSGYCVESRNPCRGKGIFQASTKTPQNRGMAFWDLKCFPRLWIILAFD